MTAVPDGGALEPLLRVRQRWTVPYGVVYLLTVLASAPVAAALFLRSRGVAVPWELAVIPALLAVGIGTQWFRGAATWVEVWPDEVRWHSYWGTRSARLSDVQRVSLTKDTVVVRATRGWFTCTGTVPEAQRLAAAVRERAPRITQPPLPG